MKKLILLLTLIPASIFAQIKPRIAFDYFIGGYNTRYEIPAPEISGVSSFTFDINKGNYRLRTGADYTLFGVTAYFDQYIYMDKGHDITFQPLQAEWYVGIKYRIGKINIKAEHLCIHPVGSIGYDGIKQYGGYNMISVGYGY